MKDAASRFNGILAMRPEMPWIVKGHSHLHHEMILVRRGSQCVEMRGSIYTAESGDILLFPSEAVHREWSHSPSQLETFCLSFIWNECPDEVPLHSRDHSGRVRVLMDWLLAESSTRTPATDSVLQSLLDALLCQFVQLTMHRAGDVLISTLRGFMRANMNQLITLDDLAETAGISKYHLTRKYREITGRPPMADLRAIRLERARELILTSAEPLKAIPAQVGVANIHHMTRLFRQHFGVTPGSLRRAASVKR
jgi:AraC-like DNA-binding protein